MNAVAKTARQIQPYEDTIKKARDRFLTIASEGVNYETESVFAAQALMKNDYTMKIANNNRQSVHFAMINVASTGLTLNPANAYAYLVPRDGAIMLDISYKGLIKIATDSGAILWARADIVYESDTFTYHGPARIPDHDADPFKTDRGNIVGCYCIAKTKDGDILTEVMPIAEIEKIRGASSAYAKTDKQGKPAPSGPWVSWFEQMAKKAVIKRASKTWPYTDDRLAQAVAVATESEGGYDLDHNPSGLPKRMVEDDRKERCDEAAVQYEQSIDFIKGEIKAWDDSQDDAHLYSVAEAWAEIPNAAQMDLWLAPTKGGIFTTYERDVIHNKLPRGEKVTGE